MRTLKEGGWKYFHIKDSVDTEDKKKASFTVMRLMSFRQMFKHIALLADQTYTSRAEGQARL